MEMSAEEIKQFWRGFCQRRKISAELVARGEAVIDKTPIMPTNYGELPHAFSAESE